MLQARKKEPTAWPAHKCASKLAWMQERKHITLPEPVHSLSWNLGMQPAKATAEHAGRHLNTTSCARVVQQGTLSEHGMHGELPSNHTKKLDAARLVVPLQVKGPARRMLGPTHLQHAEPSDCLQTRMSTLSPLLSHPFKTVCATSDMGCTSHKQRNCLLTTPHAAGTVTATQTRKSPAEEYPTATMYKRCHKDRHAGLVTTNATCAPGHHCLPA
jgi:hypothetical protein